MNRVVEFCSNCSKCPVVEFLDDSVRIGEDENVCTLTSDQWEDLKKAVLNGRV